MKDFNIFATSESCYSIALIYTFFISICSLFIIKPLYFVDAQLCPIFTLYSCVKKKHKIRSKNIVLQEILDS